MNLTQTSFTAGMTGQFVASKTPTTGYRALINGRIRRNALEGGFAPVLIRTPDDLHQAVFANDDKLYVVIAGTAYKLNSDWITVSPASGTPSMSATAERIWHQAVPAPTNFLMKQGSSTATYNTEVSAVPQCIILQDGVTQPALIVGATGRRAHTYAQWSFTIPEYVPIGKQMAFSANKLYIVSPDGKKIYQSVTGRPLDFTLNINSTTGAKLGNADTTYLAVSSAELTAILPSQDGGFLAFTRYNTFAGIMSPSFPTIFGEPYIQPRELFPVGAVSQTAFTFANGASVFVTPETIISFDQVAQQQRTSNNTPFGAAVAPYLIRPITKAACCAVDDYVFFGVSTIFGDGILVFDTQLGCYVGFDRVGVVKEFAVVRGSTGTRLFFITEANQLYEKPLYSGSRQPFSVFIGEFCAQDGSRMLRPSAVRVGLTDIKSAGDLTVRVFKDGILVGVDSKQIAPTTPEDNLLSTAPLAFSQQGRAEQVVTTANFTDTPYGQTTGVEVSCSADAAIINVQLEVDDCVMVRPTTAGRVTEDAPDVIVAVGNIQPDSATVLGDSTAAVTAGDEYVIMAGDTDAQLQNGQKIIDVPARKAVRFVAAANRVFFSATAGVYNFATLRQLLTINATGDSILPARSRIAVLGNVGASVYHSHAFSVLNAACSTVNPVTSDLESSLTLAGRAEYMHYVARPKRYLEQTAHLNLYFLCLELTTAQLASRNSSGVLPFDWDDGSENGISAGWLKSALEANAGDGRFNIVVLGFPPYSAASKFTPGLAALRWNFAKLGVHAVLANSTCYERFTENNVYYFNAGTGGPATALSGGLAVPGILRLAATGSLLSVDFVDADGEIRDRATITL